MEYQKFTELYFCENDTPIEGYFKVNAKIWLELQIDNDCPLTDDETIWKDYCFSVGYNGVISLKVDTDGFFIVDIVKA